MQDPQLELPLDERYRRAEQYALDLPDPMQPQPKPEVLPGSCPRHKAFVYECPLCNPR